MFTLEKVVIKFLLLCNFVSCLLSFESVMSLKLLLFSLCMFFFFLKYMTKNVASAKACFSSSFSFFIIKSKQFL